MREFLSDPNMDGVFSISDVWLLIKWAACLPGNTLLGLTGDYLPRVAGFFEITPASQFGWPAWGISVIAWFFLVVALQGLVDASNGK